MLYTFSDALTGWYSFGAVLAALAAGIALYYTIREDAGFPIAMATSTLLASGMWVMLFITWIDQHKKDENTKEAA